ncbi:hypothetical protein [Thalassococcus profundi]|nr:hypothetical protein [Thalassococcus profundi]
MIDPVIYQAEAAMRRDLVETPRWPWIGGRWRTPGAAPVRPRFWAAR